MERLIRSALILFCLCGLVPPVHARPAGPTELARGIDAIVDAPRFSRARWGIAVVSLDSMSLFDSGKAIPDWVHFSQPVVALGKVYVVTHDAHIYAFGLK